MTTVSDLIPGDRITQPHPDGPLTATYIAQTQHPIWTHLRLVIWRLPDRWSHDALDARQHVGEPDNLTPSQRLDNLRTALYGYPK